MQPLNVTMSSTKDRVACTSVLKHRYLLLVSYIYGPSKAAKSSCKPSSASAHLSFMSLPHNGLHSAPILGSNSVKGVPLPAAACP